MPEINYTPINHAAREKLELSWLEYGLADLIYNLSNKPESEFPSWCYASKEWLAKTMGLSRMQIHRMINTLSEKGLLERQEATKFVRTTQLWYSLAISNPVLQGVTKSYTKANKPVSQNVTGSAKMLHNNNSTNITKVILEGDPPEKVDKRDPDIQICIDELTLLLGHKPTKESLNRFSAKRLISRLKGVDKVLRSLRFAFKVRQEDRFAPKVYNFLDLEEKLDHLIDYAKASGHKKELDDTPKTPAIPVELESGPELTEEETSAARDRLSRMKTERGLAL